MEESECLVSDRSESTVLTGLDIPFIDLVWFMLKLMAASAIAGVLVTMAVFTLLGITMEVQDILQYFKELL